MHIDVRQHSVCMRIACGLLLMVTSQQPTFARTLPLQNGKQRVETIAAQHKAVFRRYVRMWERGSLDELHAVLAPNYVGHAASGSRDVDGLCDRIGKFRSLYLGVHFTIEDQVAEGDKVATRMTVAATSRATGKPVKLIGLNVSRFQDGRIAEEWPVWEVAP